MMSTMNIFDRIKELHHKLCALPDMADQPLAGPEPGHTYKQLVSAKTTKKSVEGWLAIDTFLATRILQQFAAEAGDAQIAALPSDYVHDVIVDITNRKVVLVRRPETAMARERLR